MYNKTLRNSKAAKNAAQELLNVWKNAKERAFFRIKQLASSIMKF